jgi:ribosome-binding factor A
VSKRNRRIKDAQLCAQVRETLSLTLAERPEPDLLELFVLDVAPAPDVSRLAVYVQAPAERDPDEVRARLASMAGHLRAEVAASVHRRKTPSLEFVVVPPDA